MSSINYTLRSIDSAEKVAFYGDYTFHFNEQNGFVVNVKDQILQKMDVNDSRFNQTVKQVYLFLIQNYNCLPSINVHSAIEEVLILRKNILASNFRKKLIDEINALMMERMSMTQESNKKMEKEIQESQYSVESGFSESRANLSNTQASLADKMMQVNKTEDQEQLARLQVEIQELQERLFNNQNVIERLSGDVVLTKAKITTKYREALDKKMLALDNKLAKLQSSVDKKVLEYCEELNKSDENKIKRIMDIIDEVKEGKKDDK